MWCSWGCCFESCQRRITCCVLSDEIWRANQCTITILQFRGSFRIQQWPKANVLIITLVFVGYLLHLLRMCLRSTIACGVLFAADSRSAVNVKPGLHYIALWLCFSWWHFSLLPFNRSTPAHISYLCLYDRVFMIALSNPLLFFNSFMTQLGYHS